MLSTNDIIIKHGVIFDFATRRSASMDNLSLNLPIITATAENLTSQRYYNLEKATRVYGNSFVADHMTLITDFYQNWSNFNLLSLISMKNYFSLQSTGLFLETKPVMCV